jgi:glutamate-ammonia-ligase adenylyltransferase
VISLFASSSRLVELVRRHPDIVDEVHAESHELPSTSGMRTRMREAVAGLEGDEATACLRLRYRIELAKIALYDLRLPQPAVSLHRIGEALADLASVTIDVALTLARAELSAPPSGFGRFPAEEVEAVRLAIIGMGKCGARELNYISDIDVMFVAEPAANSELSVPRAIEIATRLASTAMHILMDYAVEPPLWEVDANLRPEGKDGALVRTLDSYLNYYHRWAENWEFMALLKARPIAGDFELGERFVEAVAPLVWNAGDRDDFVLGVQRMRKRVIDHIPRSEVQRELKLGPGGLRDVEFPVQLLQIVHGQVDEHLRVRSTLDAITALTTEGHIGRDDAAQFSNDYRFLRSSSAPSSPLHPVSAPTSSTSPTTACSCAFARSAIATRAARSGTSRPSRRACHGARPCSATCCPCCWSGLQRARTPTRACSPSVSSRSRTARPPGTSGCCATRISPHGGSAKCSPTARFARPSSSCSPRR